MAPGRGAASALALALALAPAPSPHPQEPPPAEAGEAPATGGALDWDRDFDLILESRQGKKREDARKQAKVDALEADIAKVRAELDDLLRRRSIFEGNVLGDEAMAEMLRLEARTASEARGILDARLAAARTRISALEDDLKRLRRAR